MSALLRNHTIAVPLYTPYLVNGMVVPSMGTMNITITIQDGNIYFNDAKVVQPNVLTNNGMVHVLDKVMSDKVIEAAPSSSGTSTSAGATPSATTSGSPTQSSNAAGAVVGRSQGGFLAFAAGVLMLL